MKLKNGGLTFDSAESASNPLQWFSYWVKSGAKEGADSHTKRLKSGTTTITHLF